MPKIILTDLSIQKLAPGAYWDQSIPAFGVRIGKRTKTFVTVDRHGRRTTIGHYPHVTLKEARRKAHLVIGAPAEAIEKRDIQETIAGYLASINVRPRTRSDYTRLLGRLKLRGSVISLKTHTLLDLLNEYRATPIEARHMFFALSAFFSWCEERRFIKNHPLNRVKCPFKTASRSNVIPDEDLRKIWLACPDDAFGKLIRFAILTGQRRGEVAAIQSTWIKNDILKFPKEITKNGVEHEIYLTETARALLPKRNGLLFPSPITGEIMVGWSKLKPKIERRSGTKGWTIHDFRRTWSTRSADLGTPPHIIERCLNHLTGTISPLGRTYNRALYLDECKQAMCRYEQHISNLVSLDESRT